MLWPHRATFAWGSWEQNSCWGGGSWWHLHIEKNPQMLKDSWFSLKAMDRWKKNSTWSQTKRLSPNRNVSDGNPSDFTLPGAHTQNIRRKLKSPNPSCTLRFVNRAPLGLPAPHTLAEYKETPPPPHFDCRGRPISICTAAGFNGANGERTLLSHMCTHWWTQRQTL